MLNFYKNLSGWKTSAICGRQLKWLLVEATLHCLFSPVPNFSTGGQLLPPKEYCLADETLLQSIFLSHNSDGKQVYPGFLTNLVKILCFQITLSAFNIYQGED